MYITTGKIWNNNDKEYSFLIQTNSVYKISVSKWL